MVNIEDGTILPAEMSGLFLEFKLYSAENPPKPIELNTCGKAVLTKVTPSLRAILLEKSKMETALLKSFK